MCHLLSTLYFSNNRKQKSTIVAILFSIFSTKRLAVVGSPLELYYCETCQVQERVLYLISYHILYYITTQDTITMINNNKNNKKNVHIVWEIRIKETAKREKLQ